MLLIIFSKMFSVCLGVMKSAVKMDVDSADRRPGRKLQSGQGRQRKVRAVVIFHEPVVVSIGVNHTFKVIFTPLTIMVIPRC